MKESINKHDAVWKESSGWSMYWLHEMRSVNGGEGTAATLKDIEACIT